MHGACEEDNNPFHKQSQVTGKRCVANKRVSLAPSSPVAEQAHASTVPKVSALFQQYFSYLCTYRYYNWCFLF